MAANYLIFRRFSSTALLIAGWLQLQFVRKTVEKNLIIYFPVGSLWILIPGLLRAKAALRKTGNDALWFPKPSS